jgi:hypothetical protein
MANKYVGAAKFGQKVMDLIVKTIPRKKKVSPDITKVKSTKDVKGSVKKTKSDEYVKRITTLESANEKVKEGRKMMREGQKERKKMVDTGRAFQFKHSKSYHAIQPGDKPEVKYKGNVRKQKMGGGMMGRRFGYKGGKLVGNQKKIDVAAPFGTINEKDFSKLREKRSMGGGADMGRKPKKRGNPAVVIKEEPMRDRMKQPLKRKKPYSIFGQPLKRKKP